MYITIEEAADILNVSVEYAHKWISEEEIDFIGTKVSKEDILLMKQKQRVKSEKAMQELTDIAQKWGLY